MILTQIVQVGYSPQWQVQPPYVASYVAGAAKMYEGEEKGSFKAAFPDSWKEALKWYYDGMYGEQPCMATGPMSSRPSSATATSSTWARPPWL